MSILDRLFKKRVEQQYQLTNEDWLLLSSMLYRYINRADTIPSMISQTDFINYALCNNPTVYALISLRANAAKGIPWLVYKVKNQKVLRQYKAIKSKADLTGLQLAIATKEQSLEEIEKTPINNLLKKPNPMDSWQDLIESMFMYRDTTGNAYLHEIDNPITKEILQLFSLPADQVRIKPGPFTNPIAGYTFTDVYKNDVIPPEKILHWKYFNPKWGADGRQLYGLSPLAAAARVINSDNAGIDNQTASFANEGVKGVITGTEQTEIEFSAEQADILRKKLQKYNAQAKRGEGNIAFNRAPLQYLKIGETPVDLGVLESRKYNKEILCNLFRVHPALLSSDASTLNNLTDARKSLLTISVLPDMDQLRDLINDMIADSFGDGWFVDYDIMAIPELREDIEKLSNTLSKMDWITRNEKRAATNYDEYPDPAADLLYTQMSQIPLGYGMDSSFEKIDENIEKLRKEIVTN